MPCSMFVQIKLVTEYASDVRNEDFVTYQPVTFEVHLFHPNIFQP